MIHNNKCEDMITTDGKAVLLFQTWQINLTFAVGACRSTDRAHEGQICIYIFLKYDVSDLY